MLDADPPGQRLSEEVPLHGVKSTQSATRHLFPVTGPWECAACRLSCLWATFPVLCSCSISVVRGFDF